MEVVEQSNRAAVESCQRVLALLTCSSERLRPDGDLARATGDAVNKFKKLVSDLGSGDNGNGSGDCARARNAKVRRMRRPAPPDELKNLLMEAALASKTIQLIPRHQAPAVSFGSDRMPKNVLQVMPLSSVPAMPLAEFHFMQLQSYQKFQLMQHMKLQGEMFRPDNGLGNGMASSSRSFISSLSIDGNATDRSPFRIVSGSQSSSNAELPILRRCSGRDGSGKCLTKSRCHCVRRRKLRVRRTIRIPAISKNVADIPADEFSWRKYGQKPIKGSPHPRGYYKCTTMKGCPARKHVEKCVNDPAMLVVTYEGEHLHGAAAD